LDCRSLNLITVNILAISIHDASCGRKYTNFSRHETQVRDYLLLSDDVDYQALIDSAMDTIGANV